MKLYVWEDVLWDYSPGMIVALAPNLDAALDMARSSVERLPTMTAAEMGGTAPTVIDLDSEFECAVWAVHGGG